MAGDDLTKISEFKLNRYHSIIFNCISLVSFISGLFIACKINGKKLHEFICIKSPEPGQLIAMLAALLLIVFMHELIHGAAYKTFGAKLKFGLKYLNVYTMDISGTLYSCEQMLVIMLSPLFVLTGLLVIAASIFPQFYYFLIQGILFNICGSCGDILMLAFIFSKGISCKVKDEEYGFSIYK